jgi:hypothetical protein
MHTTSSNLRVSKRKKGGIHINHENITPKENVEDQSVDYADTHVGKMYPSL